MWVESCALCREVHDLCVLLGYGADAICPYLVFEMLNMLRKEGKLGEPLTHQDIYLNYVAAVARGISKVMAKMGISTLHSYKVSSVPYRTVPHRTAPHRTAPHRTAPHRTAPHRKYGFP